MDLMNAALQAKRSGKLLEALDYYAQALKLQPQNSVIYTSMGKIYFLLAQGKEACFMYRVGVEFAIMEHADKLLSIYSIKTKTGRLELLEEFFNSAYHIGHAFFDLDDKQVAAFMDVVHKQNPHLTNRQLCELMEYVIKSYASSISGGFIPEPALPKIPNWQTDFDSLYTYLGRMVLEETIDWSHFKS